MKVYEYYGMRPVKGPLGIEVEVEAENDVFYELDKYWKTVQDNSLRGYSAEFVLKQPYLRKTAIEAIKYLKKSLDERNVVLKFTHRTSVHVHVNVQHLEHGQLCCLIYLSYLLDRFFAKIGGREISGNRFALRISDAERQVFVFKQMCEKGNYYIPDEGDGKYSVVNLAPVNRYGSVEYRSMRGTLDVELLEDWINILTNVFKFSTQFSSIEDMMEGFLGDELGFVKRIIGEELYNKYALYPSFVDDLRINYSLLIDCMYSQKVIPSRNEAARINVVNAAPIPDFGPHVKYVNIDQYNQQVVAARDVVIDELEEFQRNA